MESKLIALIEATKTIELKSNHYYRYILPSKIRPGLTSFYGDDCSFSRGHLFDSTDFLVEFGFTKDTPVKPLSSHEGSYRGRLHPDNTKIISLYYRNPPVEFYQKQFDEYFQQLYKDLPEQTLFFEVDSYLSCTKVCITKISKKYF